MTIDISSYAVTSIKSKRHDRSQRAKIFADCLKLSLFKKHKDDVSERYFSSISVEQGFDYSGADVIVVACDPVYFWDYAIPFMRSLAAVGEKFNVHLHLIHPTTEVVDRAKRLALECPTVAISLSIDPLSGLQLPQQLNIYYNCARFIFAKKLLEMGAKRLLILDVDTIARSSPWRKLDNVKTLGAFRFRPKARKSWHKILAGTVYIENSDQTQTFMHKLSKALLVTLAKNPTYHIDQIIPYYLLKIGFINFRGVFGSMPDDVMSLNYDHSASLWMAKGKEKKSDRFKAELGKLNK